MKKLMGMKCSHCGSTLVGADLASEWSTARQQWEAVGDLDGRVCHDCGVDPVEVEAFELRGQERADAMHARRLAGIEDFVGQLRTVLTEGGAIAHLVLPELIEQASAIRSKLHQYAATMAQQDELIDALALTIPYAESRAEDLERSRLGGDEDETCPGGWEATSVVVYAERVLIQHGGEPYLLERGQRAGAQS